MWRVIYGGVVCGVGLGSVATALAETPPGDARPRQVFARSWHTVIIPTPVAAWPVATVTFAVRDGERSRPPGPPRVLLAALAPPLPASKPLVGAAHQLTGIASYYWQDQMTSSGERFNKRDMTAAHKTLPMGTRVRVTHVSSGRAVVVRINDRGPFKPGRVIDLSEAAAEKLSMTAAGLAQVLLEVIE
jgi:rare lipoprotein A